MKTTYVVITTLVLFNLMLLYQQSDLKLRAEKRDFDPQDYLELFDGEEPSGQALATLYVFYHADESCGCLDDWENWVAFHDRYAPAIRVKGIFNGSDITKFRQFNEGVDIPFPTYLDPDSQLRNQYLVPPNMPTKVLVGPNGHVLLSDVYQDSPRDQHYFLKRLEAHGERILNRGHRPG